MVEVSFGLQTMDLPYSLRFYGVTEERFKDLVDEDTKAELLDGVMMVHSPASLEHDKIGGFIRSLMSFYADEKDAGSVLGPDSLVHLATCRLFAPDVFYLHAARVQEPLPQVWEGSPDLVIEILSPSNRSDDLEDKRPAYRQAGVKEIWFVDPDNQEIKVDRKLRKAYKEESFPAGKVLSQVLAGFWIDASWLWADPLPRKLTCLKKILARS